MAGNVSSSTILPTAGRMILRARIVVPVARKPLDNGAVEISGDRIVAVGPWRKFSGAARASVVDLGEVVLLPGLVNAHCHLDYTDMAGQFLPPKSFTDWIKLITTAKAGWSYSDFAQSWLNGAKMLLRTGTTTVADIEAVPELLPEVWDATPLRIHSFLEMTGIRSRRHPQVILNEAVDIIKSLTPGRCHTGLSPHASYSTVPELLRLSAQTAREHNWRMVTHVAESAAEFEMFVRGRGEMFDWLRRNERDMSDCGRGSPVQHLERNGMLGRNLLAIHVNHLVPGDARLLGRRKVSVVHCPRSHDFFSHARFPLPDLLGAGVNVCLGTDSLATVEATWKQTPELNLFAEMQAFAANHPEVSPETILAMVTRNGARALGLRGRAGQISPGALADLIALPTAGNGADIYETVLHHRGNVAASMIGGQWAMAPS
jgi:aminodeoxyfutalosine deaminase